MRKATLFTAIFLVFGLCARGSAFDLDGGLRIGYLSPTGDLGDDFDGGMTLGLFGEVVSKDHLALEAAFSRAELDMEGDWEERPELEKWLLELNSKVYFLPEGLLKPYIKGGLVADFWKIDKLDADGTNFGLDGGVGLSFALTETLSLGGEAAYYYLWSDRDSESLLGYDNTFWNLFFGLTYRP